MQRLWLEPDTYGLVLERTRLDNPNEIVTFIGAGELPGPDGARLIHPKVVAPRSAEDAANDVEELIGAFQAALDQ